MHKFLLRSRKEEADLELYNDWHEKISADLFQNL